MEYIISALWLALECVAFFLFASAFLPYRHNSKRTLLTALCVCILFLLNQSLVLPALVRRLCALSFGLCLIVFLFQGRLEQRIFIGLLDYILIAAMDAIVLFGASTLLRISLDELVWKKGMYTVLVTAGKILSVFLAWLITRLHPFHRLHPLRPKWMLLVSLFPLTSLFMLMALFLICRDQRDLTQPVAFFCIFLGIANVAIVYVISLIERDTEVKQQIKKQYGEDPLKNSDYGKIINEKHFLRIVQLINSDKVVYGGNTNKNTLQIEPTVMDHVTWGDAVMQEEIFGPILPVLTYRNLDELIMLLQSKEHPLAFYVFSSKKETIKKLTTTCQFGGGCINDTIIHLANSQMGFGGVGASGMGSYHGKIGFETFSHRKSIVDKKTWLDLPMRYQPYTSLYERMVRFFLK